MQQPPLPPSNLPLGPITTQQIQKYLEDNKNLILAILECQKLGKFQECAQYQAVLQKNLMYLAAIADAQPPNPSKVMQTPPSSIPQASNFIQQPPPHQQPGGGQKLPFHQQQQFQAQMGARFGYQNGVFGMQTANAGGKQGGDGRGMFYDNGSYRDA